MFKPTVVGKSSRSENQHRIFTLDAECQPGGVVNDGGDTFIDTDKCSLHALAHASTKERLLCLRLSAYLCRDLEKAVVSQVVIDKHIPAHRSHLLESNAIVQAGEAAHVSTDISAIAHGVNLKLFVGVGALSFAVGVVVVND